VTAYRQRVGAVGEDLAARWYTDAGYEIVARNWRSREGELDLVARGHGTTVFCEVKTRASDRFGLPAEAVTGVKQRRIRGLAMQFLHQHPQPTRDIRFDVAAVLDGQLQVLEGAF
jgi:putative endonuclease